MTHSKSIRSKTRNKSSVQTERDKSVKQSHLSAWRDDSFQRDSLGFCGRTIGPRDRNHPWICWLRSTASSDLGTDVNAALLSASMRPKAKYLDYVNYCGSDSNPGTVLTAIHNKACHRTTSLAQVTFRTGDTHSNIITDSQFLPQASYNTCLAVWVGLHFLSLYLWDGKIKTRTSLADRLLFYVHRVWTSVCMCVGGEAGVAGFTPMPNQCLGS